MAMFTSNSRSLLGRSCSLPQAHKSHHIPLRVESCSQVRHATLIRRPKRPYTFAQLVRLSDGSAFVHRTTSHIPYYKTEKDTRNNSLWNPSDRRMVLAEDDAAGKLKGFRARYGRAFDASTEYLEVCRGVMCLR